jgi:hypothetical protein
MTTPELLENPFIDRFDYFDRAIRSMYFTGLGRTYHTHGDLGGLEGVWNLQGGVKGIYDAPVKTTWKTGAFQDGSTQKAVKRLHRDMVLGFGVVDTENRGAEENESDFRQIFDYAVDEWDDEPEPTTLHMVTDRSGERRLDLLMYDTPEINDADIDPIEQQYFGLILKVRAGQPDWYELDPTTGKEFKSFWQNGATDAEGYIEVYNPTDRPCRQEWVLTRATWTVPDLSWRGGKYRRRPGGQWADRALALEPITDVQGGIRISLDPQKLHIRDFNNTNAVASMLKPGLRFLHVIPPYTPRTLIPISYINAPAGGARAELIQPRRWTRPWGQE